MYSYICVYSDYDIVRVASCSYPWNTFSLVVLVPVAAPKWGPKWGIAVYKQSPYGAPTV